MDIEKRVIIDLGSFEIHGINVKLEITEVVLTSWVVMLALTLCSYFVSKRLRVENPGRLQLLVETLLIAMARQIREFSGMPAGYFFNLIATMWLFVGASNIIGLVPPFTTPTGDLWAVAGLSTITFLSIFYFGIKLEGVSYLKRYFEPFFFLFPLNVIGELARILSLTFRLFGNMAGWDLIIGILVLLTGVLVPVPLMLFNVLGDIIQAYIFGILSLAFIIAGIDVEKVRERVGYVKEDWYDL